MSKKFKKRFLIPCESYSSSEEKDDGLFTATEMIKAEHKKLENRLSDQDLLDIKRKAMAEQEHWKSKQERDKQALDTSEPLTKSIMSMRSMPISKLISQKSPSRSFEESMPDLINFGTNEESNDDVKREDVSATGETKGQDIFIFQEGQQSKNVSNPEDKEASLNKVTKPKDEPKVQKDPLIYQEGQLSKSVLRPVPDTCPIKVTEFKDPKQMELKALKLFKQLSVELGIDENDEDNTPVMSPIIKGFTFMFPYNKLCNPNVVVCMYLHVPYVQIRSNIN